MPATLFGLPVLIRPRLFLLLFTGFILTTIIGTLSHESGHWLAAKALGYDAQIHFASTSFDSKKADSISAFVNDIIEHRQKELKSGEPYPGKEQFDHILHQRRISGSIILFGGPLQTMLAGTTGLLLFFIFRKKWPGTDLKWKQWILVLLTLFWAREPVNLIVFLGKKMITGHWSQRMDEIRLEQLWGLPRCSIIIPLAIIGLIVMAFVTFRTVPANLRATFIAAATTGGIAGYILWLSVAGPILMP